MPRRISGFLVALIVAGSLISPAAAQRVALVIGNSDYKTAKALKNPVNDAADIGSALSRLGFTVTTLTNGTGEEMKRAVAEFGGKARGSDIALIYFAGHAVEEAAGRHWNIPVDGKLESLGDIEKDSVSLLQLLSAASGGKLRLVLIDAARDNPFATDARRVPSSATIYAPAGSTLIVHSTKAGTRPFDGEGRNSPFAAALLKHMETPNLDASILMNRVRDEVLVATQGEQEPFVYGSLAGNTVSLAPR
jgi:uncharacterized caspase-like protein